MAHTPGPWTVDGRFDIWADLPGGWTAIVATLVEGRFASPPSVALERQVVEANARLIIAASDLLAACKAAYFLLGIQSGDPSLPIMRQLGAAIAKAEGRTP